MKISVDQINQLRLGRGTESELFFFIFHFTENIHNYIFFFEKTVIRSLRKDFLRWRKARWVGKIGSMTSASKNLIQKGIGL